MCARQQAAPPTTACPATGCIRALSRLHIVHLLEDLSCRHVCMRPSGLQAQHCTRPQHRMYTSEIRAGSCVACAPRSQPQCMVS